MWINITLPLKMVQQSNDNFYYKISIKLNIDLSFSVLLSLCLQFLRRQMLCSQKATFQFQYWTNICPLHFQMSQHLNKLEIHRLIELQIYRFTDRHSAMCTLTTFWPVQNNQDNIQDSQYSHHDSQNNQQDSHKMQQKVKVNLSFGL